MSDLSEQFDPFGIAEAAEAGQREHIEYHQVLLPSGAILEVITAKEAEHAQAKVFAYVQQYDLDNIADVSEIDRCIQLELLIHRYNSWLARRRDYDGHEIDENILQKNVSSLGAELRQVKKDMGINKVKRDQTSGRGSLHEYINNLLTRVHHFGLMRNEQVYKALELSMELASLMTLRANCATDKERRMTRCTDEDIFEWISEVFIPEMEAIDALYRDNDQKLWILADA